MSILSAAKNYVKEMAEDIGWYSAGYAALGLSKALEITSSACLLLSGVFERAHLFSLTEIQAVHLSRKGVDSSCSRDTVSSDK